MDYRDTLNLPKTDFPMRASLPQREPHMLARWDAMDLYGRIMARNAAKPPFVLHDGPPYANGHIHPGTVLNKVLKDIIVKHRNMTGRLTEFIPGWDCHGLPIEHSVEREARLNKETTPKPVIRRHCRDYALRFLDIQRNEFRRVGVLGRWNEPYLTLNHSYESAIIREFGEFVRRGAVYRGKKPIYWCHECQTALAEAEIEYQDHVSPSIYVKFPMAADLQSRLPELAGHPGFMVIWTTTPWTLPANLAIALHPEHEYSLVLTDRGEAYVIATFLVPVVAEDIGFTVQAELARFSGARLEGAAAHHPFIDRRSTIILGDHVTLDAGTGAVHTAPGHGAEDYVVGRAYGLDVYAPVDDLGRFTAEVPEFAGRLVFDTNDDVCTLLEQRGMLLKKAKVAHSYPHCWRSKNPIIFRATDQWFISMTETGLRDAALRETARVRWIPPWGRDRFEGMVKNRPDWCISRQRSWGVPIPAFYCESCGELLLEADVIDHVAGVFAEHGSDSWFTRPVADLLPPGTRCRGCGGASFRTEQDILDVWFESGVSWAAVMEPRIGRDKPVDLYLEGSDQHRGWFQSAMLTGVGTRDHAPYEAVLTHGFVVDGEGRKMSKSLGNYVPPEEVIAKYGAEVLRLWTASVDYREDIRLSDEILTRLADAYRKLRNTARFLLSNLYDFDPARDTTAGAALEPIDRYMRERLAEVVTRVRTAYERFDFHLIHFTMVEFATVDLSAFYLDILKDRLYASRADDPARRAAQTVLYDILRAYLTLLAPILSFTADEAWQHTPRRPDDPDSVFLLDMPAPPDAPLDQALLDDWKLLRDIRTVAARELEAARNAKVVGHSLEATVRLTVAAGSDEERVLRQNEASLATLFIVSAATVDTADGATLGAPVVVTVAAMEGGKCSRCWIRSPALGQDPAHPELCPRCTAVAAGGDTHG